MRAQSSILPGLGNPGVCGAQQLPQVAGSEGLAGDRPSLPRIVISAKAGIQHADTAIAGKWIPACAGMTEQGAGMTEQDQG